MIRIDRLSSLLSSLGLTKESAQVLKIPTGEMSEEDLDEAISEFGEPPDEEEELLKKTPVPPKLSGVPDEDVKNEVMKMLVGKGIYPVVAGDKDVLGSGRLGSVIRVIYNGKPAVAKISIHQGDDGSLNNDIPSWAKILALFPSMPEEVKKHIPEVYFTDFGSFETGYDYLDEYDIIVMEELKKIPTTLIDVMQGRNLPKHTTQKALRDFIINFNNTLGVQYGLNVVPVQEFVDSVPYFYATKDGIAWILLQRIMKDNLGLGSDKALDIHEDIKEQLLFNKYFEHSLRKKFPRSAHFDGEEEYQGIDELESFIAALRWLKGHGVNWGDMHSGNVMLGNDGNLKIMDVGAYY